MSAVPGTNVSPSIPVPSTRAGLLKLNIGSGRRRLPGFLSVDNNANAGEVDVAHDLERLPWPFDASSAGEVVMEHSLEHLEDTIGTVRELYRICADGAKIEIRVPHLSCAWNHPGHKKAIGVGLFDHFDPQHDERYGDCRFKVESVRLRWMQQRYQTNIIKQAASGLISFFANLNVRFCQRVWCYWVGGFEEIEFHVRVIK